MFYIFHLLIDRDNSTECGFSNQVYWFIIIVHMKIAPLVGKYMFPTISHIWRAVYMCHSLSVSGSSFQLPFYFGYDIGYDIGDDIRNDLGCLGFNSAELILWWIFEDLGSASEASLSLLGQTTPLALARGRRIVGSGAEDATQMSSWTVLWHGVS